MILKLDEGTYEGEVKNNQPHGFGKIIYDDENTEYYEGQFVDGLRHGTGKIVFTDGEFAEGVWEEDGFVYGKRENKYGYYLGYFADGEQNGYGEEVMKSGRSWKGMWENGRKVAHEKSDVIPNAVRIWPLGNFDLVRIEDFSTGKGLGKPLNCDSVDIISTEDMREMSKILETTVVGYIDSYASQKDFVNNYLMCELSGYEYLPGPCIICGFENNDYAPLDYEVAEIIFDCLADISDEDIE